VVDFLRTFLPAYPDEEPDDERFRAFVITDLLDLKAREAYPDIEAAFVEGRVDDMVVGLDDVQEELGIRGKARPRKRAGFELRLKCQECGFVRPHAVDVVYCDLATQERRTRGEETKYSEFIIPQRIICPRCNAVDHYELTSEAHLAMTAELLKLAIPGGKVPGLGDGTQRLRLMRFTIKDGREMHPLEALEMYQRRVDENPGDVRTRVRYANVLFFLRRWDEARAQFEEAQTRDPSNADTYFGLAQTAEVHEDVETALTMYEEYLARVPRRPKQKDEREAWEYAQDTVEALRRQQAGVLGRVAGTVGQMARTGGKLLGLTDRSGSSTLLSWKDSSQYPAQRQGKKAARQARRRARKRKRKKKK
jgi:tetratricopeptide (TPR) repeat protein